MRKVLHWFAMLAIISMGIVLFSCGEKTENLSKKVEELNNKNAELTKENAELKEKVSELTNKIEGITTIIQTDELQVGFVYVSPIGDAGWSYAHDKGRMYIDSMDGVTTSFVEAVSEGPDSERVMLNMARKDYDLIFATSYGYMDPMLKVAKQFPKVILCIAPGSKQLKIWATISVGCIKPAICPE